MLQNAVLCLIFGLALLAGAIVNGHYGSDNYDIYDDSICPGYENDYDDYDSLIEDVCDDLAVLFVAEYAAAVSSKYLHVAVYMYVCIYIVAI